MVGRSDARPASGRAARCAPISRATVAETAPEAASGGEIELEPRDPAAEQFFVDCDLFGDPIRPPWGKVGRPPHRPSAALRAQVRQLSARRPRLTQEEIAAAIGVTAPTLRLHYHVELGSSSQAWRRRNDRGSD